VKNENINKITITGGEPFLQQNELLLLITEIKKLNKEICIYTNGTIEIDKNLFDLVHIILDYKLDYTDKINNNNITNLKNGILKFVIDDINKFKNLNLDIVKIYNNNNKIHITPAFNYIDNKDIADYLINNNLNNIKLALQQHKYIWNPEERSV
jgi:7-carboxy-7-deazaguanine synthase